MINDEELNCFFANSSLIKINKEYNETKILYLDDIKYDNDNNVIINLLETFIDDNLSGSILIFLPNENDIIHTKELILNSKYKDKYDVILNGNKYEDNKMYIINFNRKTSPNKLNVILLNDILDYTIIENVIIIIDRCINNNVYCSKYDCIKKTHFYHSKWCYRLINRNTFEKIDKIKTPEIKECSLDEICLYILYLNLDQPHNILLENSICKVPKENIDKALNHLIDLSLCKYTKNKKYKIIQLGYNVVHLLVNPSIGKMLIISSLMGCLKTALTMASILMIGFPFNDYNIVKEKLFKKGNNDIINAIDMYIKNLIIDIINGNMLMIKRYFVKIMD